MFTLSPPDASIFYRCSLGWKIDKLDKNARHISTARQMCKTADNNRLNKSNENSMYFVLKQRQKPAFGNDN